MILRQALGGEEGRLSLVHFGEVIGSRLFLDGLHHTLVIAVSATAGCLLLGFILSLIIAFVPFPGARLVGRLIDTFIALPTFLVALAFTFIYGSAGLLNELLMRLLHLGLPPVDFLYSQWGVILSEITVYTPFVMRPLLAAFSLIEPAQIEVAEQSLCRVPCVSFARSSCRPRCRPSSPGKLVPAAHVERIRHRASSAQDMITLPLSYDKAIQESITPPPASSPSSMSPCARPLFPLSLRCRSFGGRRAGLV